MSVEPLSIGAGFVAVEIAKAAGKWLLDREANRRERDDKRRFRAREKAKRRSWNAAPSVRTRQEWKEQVDHRAVWLASMRPAHRNWRPGGYELATIRCTVTDLFNEAKPIAPAVRPIPIASAAEPATVQGVTLEPLTSPPISMVGLRALGAEIGLNEDDQQSLVDAYREATDFVSMIAVKRIYNEALLSPDRDPSRTSLALTDEQAFQELLRLSGLPKDEIDFYGLTFERMHGPAGLIEELKALTGDTFDMERTEVSVPLAINVLAALTRRKGS
ncbi:hypothetical protein [Methylobacterium oryzae]|uniref:hypothetical protein n=1 Tax=Methylobacterium oryzae TaxID=334852 RepID=UPI001F238E33|nr:hypothetical protein [Methylobacterium oryzae]UIN38397.1 hypothetical protein LXM90_30915 [Methylobacterium oryzae]